MGERVFNVLFLGTGNAARSIIAEAILNREGRGRFRAYSAGVRPTGRVDPLVLKLLAATNYPTEPLRSKSAEAFLHADAPVLDFVFTVCDQAAEAGDFAWPGEPMTAHWALPDLADAGRSELEQATRLAESMRMINTRVGIFCALPLRSLTRLALQRRLDAIGASEPSAAGID